MRHNRLIIEGGRAGLRMIKRVLSFFGLLQNARRPGAGGE